MKRLFVLILGLLLAPLLTAQEIRIFTEQEKFNAPGSDATSFGAAVAVHGNTAIVSSFGTDTDDGTNAYVRTGSNWTFQQEIVSFGGDVALIGDIVLIGVNDEDTPDGVDAGAVYVYVRSGTTWSEETVLYAENAEAGDGFGASVAIDGNTAVIGAVFDDTLDGEDAGSAYAFVRNGTTWTQQDQLFADDGAAFDYFGNEVAAEGGRAVVSSPEQDAAYVFVRSGTSWSQQDKLTTGDATADDSFGDEVAIEGDFVFVGADNDDTPAGENAGSVYVFRFTGGNWIQQQNLKANDAAAEEQFGYDLAADDDVLLIGAAFEDVSGLEDRGAAYIFTRNGNNWTQYGKLTASDDEAYDIFGSEVSYEGSTALVGAPGVDNGSSDGAGAAYAFFDPVIAVTPTAIHTSTSASTSTPNATNTAIATGTPDGTTTPAATTTIQITNTPDGTTTPGATVTPTSTPDGSIELLLNGGFETDSEDDNIPDGWTQKTPSGDKRKCNKDGKPATAFEGECAYQFKGSIGENSKLQQTVPVTSVNSGETITLGGFYTASGSVNAKVKLRVKYTDPLLDKGKVNVNIVAAESYTPFIGELSLLLLGEPQTIKVQLQNKGTSGKVRFDALSLKLFEVSLLPLP